MAKIRKTPLFLFVVHCFCLRVSVKAILALSGADYATVSHYIRVLRGALCEKVKEEHVGGGLKLGGAGKVVEIDEMYLCHPKYHVGRRTVKEGIWVLGMIEVDAASHPIETPDALHTLRVREEKREQAARERAERRKRLKERQMMSN